MARIDTSEYSQISAMLDDVESDHSMIVRFEIPKCYDWALLRSEIKRQCAERRISVKADICSGVLTIQFRKFL